MRLINARSLRVEEHFLTWDGTAYKPRYAILSHTWHDGEEVTFADLTHDHAFDQDCRSKPGFAKILRCCQQALLDDIDFVWADTCCIDKSSSAELSEAINSMFKWYQRAVVCYAYLADVTLPPTALLEPAAIWSGAQIVLSPTYALSHAQAASSEAASRQPQPSSPPATTLNHSPSVNGPAIPSKKQFAAPISFGTAVAASARSASAAQIALGHSVNHEVATLLGSSRWFTRGWTLQELLAPSVIQFYDAMWTFMGTKEDLVDALSDITRIPTLALVESGLEQFTVAQKMSWAARRVTSREEDISYCLLGIFDISMPLLYGEGHKRAFMRLQEEIMRRYDDDSLFAWRLDEDAARALPLQQHQKHLSDTPTSAAGLAVGGSPGRGGLLATSPACFEGCEGVLSIPTDPMVDFLKMQVQAAPASFTNCGWRVQRMTWRDGYWLLMPLRCWDVKRQPGPGKSIISITLTEHGWHDTNQYSRLDLMTVSVAELHAKQHKTAFKVFYLLPYQPHDETFGLDWIFTSRDVWIRSIPDGYLLDSMRTSSPSVTMSEKSRLCRGLEEGNWAVFVFRCPSARSLYRDHQLRLHQQQQHHQRNSGLASPTQLLQPLPNHPSPSLLLTPAPTATVMSRQDPEGDMFVALFVFCRFMSERPFCFMASGPDAETAVNDGMAVMMSPGLGQAVSAAGSSCPGPDGVTLHVILDAGDKDPSVSSRRRYVVDVFAMGNNQGAMMWDNSPCLTQGPTAAATAADHDEFDDDDDSGSNPYCDADSDHHSECCGIGVAYPHYQQPPPPQARFHQPDWSRHPSYAHSPLVKRATGLLNSRPQSPWATRRSSFSSTEPPSPY